MRGVGKFNFPAPKSERVSLLAGKKVFDRRSVFSKAARMMFTSDGMESNEDTSVCLHTSGYLDDYIRPTGSRCRVFLYKII